jgi:starch synthase (maltosyl-transferring)
MDLKHSKAAAPEMRSSDLEPRTSNRTNSFPAALSTILIERVSPELDGGRYPVKREVGDRLEVTADIFKEGHEVLMAVLRYRSARDADWREAPMRPLENDRWAGWFDLTDNTRYHYTIAAWVSAFASWR